VIGGSTGGVRLVSLSKGEVVGALAGHAEGESVEAIQFVDLVGTGASAGPGVVATGGTDGKICVWDLSTMRLRTTFEHQVRDFPIVLYTPRHTPQIPYRVQLQLFSHIPPPKRTCSFPDPPTRLCAHGTCAPVHSCTNTRDIAGPCWALRWPCRDLS
jgi:hypothetical protein